MIRTIYSIDELPIGACFIYISDGKIRSWSQVSEKTADGIELRETLKRFLQMYPDSEIHLI